MEEMKSALIALNASMHSRIPPNGILGKARRRAAWGRRQLVLA
ncbi:hypothetical protein ACKKBF_B40500 [Auxenochlorella protothecoides x Auxenochlorella symbiontica]